MFLDMCFKAFGNDMLLRQQAMEELGEKKRKIYVYIKLRERSPAVSYDWVVYCKI